MKHHFIFFMVVLQTGNLHISANPSIGRISHNTEMATFRIHLIGQHLGERKGGGKKRNSLSYVFRATGIRQPMQEMCIVYRKATEF